MTVLGFDVDSTVESTLSVGWNASQRVGSCCNYIDLDEW
jgi:hypothetical protein